MPAPKQIHGDTECFLCGTLHPLSSKHSYWRHRSKHHFCSIPCHNKFRQLELSPLQASINEYFIEIFPRWSYAYELSKNFNCARTTVGNALDKLYALGYLQFKPTVYKSKPRYLFRAKSVSA